MLEPAAATLPKAGPTLHTGVSVAKGELRQAASAGVAESGYMEHALAAHAFRCLQVSREARTAYGLASVYMLRN